MVKEGREGEKGRQRERCCLLVDYHPSNTPVNVRDGSAQTVVCAATLRQKLQIQLAISPSHSILMLGHPVPDAARLTGGGVKETTAAATGPGKEGSGWFREGEGGSEEKGGREGERQTEGERCCYCLLVACCSSIMLVYLRDRSAQTVAHAATLRQKLQLKLSISPSHSMSKQGLPSTSADTKTPGAWQGSHWSANF